MAKIGLFLALGLVFSSGFLYAASIATDASFTLGTAVTGTSSGNTQRNPIVWSKCSWEALWQLNPDPWGVNPDAKGSITMTYGGNGSVVTKVDLSGLKLAGVNGYPFIFYGHDPYGYHMDGQPLVFPVQLKSLSSLTIDASYTLSIPGSAPGDLDVAFDEWLIPDPSYTGGSSGSLEVLIAPYFKFGSAPAGTFVGTVTQPVIVNGKTTSTVFDEYSTGMGPGHLIVFFPRDGQIASGDIRFNLLDFMKIGASTAGLDYDWYLAGIEFGTEFGKTSEAKYTLTTNKLSIEEEFITGR